MANAAFSPKDFKAWVVEETDTGNNAGALDAPAITSGLFQLDVDSVAFPSIAPNQNLDVRTSVGRVLPLTIKPASPAESQVDLTVDALLISPTAAPISANIAAVIKGSARLLSKGDVFTTESPALRFDFPASGNGDNFFEATIGNIAAGRGREIKEKDVSFTTNLETGTIEFELRLSDGIRSLTAIDDARNITQNVVDITASGSIGIVPIRITNLFNNESTIFRVGINSDSTKDSDLIRQIADQGGSKLQS